MAGYWTTYRTVTREILAPVAGVDDKLAKAPRYSLVVLPFANVSGDSDQDYFAQGLTIDLTTDLSHYLSGSFVIAPTTAFTYKGKAVDPKQVGRELGVRYVLEGSVQRIGETITVNAQLISTESGAQIWAVRLDGERSRLDELRAEFVSRLTRWMGGSIVHAESLRAMRERPSNPDATDLVMRGFVTMGFSTMETYTPENVKKAIGIFDQALRLDADKENALVGKATCQIILLAYFQIGDAQEVYRDVEHAADRVLAANPFNPGARRLKAIVLETRGQYDAALAQLNAAIESNPNFGDAYAQIGEIMTFWGDPRMPSSQSRRRCASIRGRRIESCLNSWRAERSSIWRSGTRQSSGARSRSRPTLHSPGPISDSPAPMAGSGALTKLVPPWLNYRKAYPATPWKNTWLLTAMPTRS